MDEIHLGRIQAYEYVRYLYFMSNLTRFRIFGTIAVDEILKKYEIDDLIREIEDWRQENEHTE